MGQGSGTLCLCPSETDKLTEMKSASRDDAEDLDDAQDQARFQMFQGAQRRKGIAAESVNTKDIKDWVKPTYPKENPDAKNRIRNVLRNNPKMQVLLGHLDDSGMDDIVNAFKDCKASSGDTLIKQGDEGDSLYILDSGEVDIFVARPGVDGKPPTDIGTKVLTCGADSLFGELALLYSAPRAATAKVSSEQCRLWQLDREPFKMLLMQKSHLQQELYQGWLTEIDIFKTLNHYELSRLSDLLTSTLFDGGEEIVRQGEHGDKFYILEDGCCSAYLQGHDGEKLVKQYIQQGEYFGEIALLKDEPRKATVRAVGEGATVLSISKEDFTTVLGPIQDILRRRIDEYPQYAELLK